MTANLDIKIDEKQINKAEVESALVLSWAGSLFLILGSTS